MLVTLCNSFCFPGYFPHLFNKNENCNYVGTLPDMKYYSPDTMRVSQHKNFTTWYKENKDNIFDFQKELESYCISDVDILRRSCLKFRANFMDVTTVDPFETTCTIAAACMRVYRTKFLTYETIGLIPHGGYRLNDKYSIIAVKWLKWVEKTEKIQIKHAMNGGEQRIGTYKVDGLHGKRVFEFNVSLNVIYILL